MENKLQTFDVTKRNLYITEDIDEKTSDDIIKWVTNLITGDNNIIDENKKALKEFFGHNIKEEIKIPDVNVWLDTYGGTCYQGYAIHDMLIMLNNHCKTNITATGACMSAGICILLSVPYEQRFATKNTTFLIHQASSVAIGKTADLEDDVKEAKRLTEMIYKLIIEETAITRKELEDNYSRKKDWILTSEEALKLKIISKII